MQMYIIGLGFLKTKLCMLQEEFDQGSKSVYLEEMEARVHFQKDIIKEYSDTIADYQTWHQFVTEDHREKVDKLVFP